MSWKNVKLENLGTIVRGSSPRPQGDKRYYGGTVPRLMIEDLTRDGKYVTPHVDSLTEEGAKLSRPMKKGELVITVSGRTGVPAILNVNACIHDGFVGFRDLSDEVNIDYLYNYLSSLTIVTSQQAVGAIFKNLTTEQLKNIIIPLPPLPIQKRIAEILDAADALRRKDKELLRKYDELTQAIFIDMFGDPVKNEKGWKRKSLEEVIIFPSGLVDPRLTEYKDMYHVGGDNIDSKTGRIFGLKHAKELGLISGKFYFTSNHILYNKIRPYLNKVALPDFNGICSADMYPLLPKENEVLKEYLYFILRSPFFLDFADKQSRRANIPKINMTEMSLFELPVPPIDIQAKFISKLGGLNKNIDSVSTCTDLSSNLFDSLLQQAFKGELVK